MKSLETWLKELLHKVKNLQVLLAKSRQKSLTNCKIVPMSEHLKNARKVTYRDTHGIIYTVYKHKKPVKYKPRNPEAYQAFKELQHLLHS